MECVGPGQKAAGVIVVLLTTLTVWFLHVCGRIVLTLFLPMSQISDI
jgi:hypothetical protein